MKRRFKVFANRNCKNRLTKSVLAARHSNSYTIKASEDIEDKLWGEINDFYFESVNRLNKRFKGVCSWDADGVGSVYGVTSDVDTLKYYKEDIIEFINVFAEFMSANEGNEIYDALSGYLDDEMYKVITSDKIAQYIRENYDYDIEDPDWNDSNHVYQDADVTQEHIEDFAYYDVFPVVKQIAKDICSYFTNFAMSLEDSLSGEISYSGENAAENVKEDFVGYEVF